MNMLKYVILTALGIIKAGKDWTEDSIKRSEAMAKVTLGATLVPGLLGLLIGRIGLGNSTAEGIGQGLITFAGLIGAVLISWLYLRAVVLVEVLTNATGAVKSVAGEKTPALSREKADNFLGFLRGYSAWIMVIALFGQVVPLYRNLTLTAIIATGTCFLAGAMGAKWTDPGKYRARVVSASLLLLLGCALSLAFPRGMTDLRNRVGVKLDRLSFRSQTETRTDATALEAERQTAAANQEILEKLLKDKTRIERRAAELCEGRFCTPKDEEHYRQLRAAIRDAKDGKYFERLSGLEKYEPSPWKRFKGVLGSDGDGDKSQPTAASPLTADGPSSVATASPPSLPPLPPPPSSPGGAARLAPPSVDSPTPTPRTRGRIATPPADKDNYGRMLSDLDSKYPDVN